MELDNPTSVYYSLVGLILGLVSIVGYAILGVAIWNRIELQKKTIWLMSLALSDLIISINLLVSSFSLFNLHWSFGEMGCKANAIINLSCGFVAIASMTWIAVDLYYQNCKPEKCGLNYGFFIGMVWTLSFAAGILPLFGFGAYEDVGNMGVLCLVDMSNNFVNRIYIIMVALVWFAYPLMKMVICYKKLVQESNKFQMHAIVVLSIFILSYAPMAVYAGLKVTVGLAKIPLWMTAIIYGLPKLLSATNPYLYMRSDPELLQACKGLFWKEHGKKH